MAKQKERISILDEVILALGKGFGPYQQEFDVKDLNSSVRFHGFVMHMLEKFSLGLVNTPEDQSALLANVFQAGINVGVAYQSHMTGQLLEACKVSLNYLRHVGLPSSMEAEEYLNDAIAKAEGRTS